MAQFSYQAYTADGGTTAGEIDALTEADALQKLSLRGLIAYSTSEVRSSLWQTEFRFRRKMRGKDTARLLRNLGTLLDASVPVDAALRLSAGQSDTSLERSSLKGLHDSVVEGDTLSAAMARQPGTFERNHVAIVKAGELSGNLSSVLLDLCTLLERQAEVRSRLAAAAIYPAILFAMALFAVALVFSVMVPALRPLFEGQSRSMPLVLEIGAAMAGFLGANWHLVIVGTTATIIACVLAVRTERAKIWIDRTLLGLPVIGRIVRESEAARFARLLSVLLKGGVPFPTSLAMTSDATRNRTCRRDLRASLEALRLGARPADALASFSVMPQSSHGLIAIGAETNRLPEMLSRVAELNEKSVARRIEGLMAILTPALTIAMGLLVGGLIMSVMNAILSANELAF